MLPQQAPAAKNKFLTLGGILMLLFYTLQNYIPGIGNVPPLGAFAIIIGIILGTLLLFLPELIRDIPAFLEHITAYSRFFFPKFLIFFLFYYLVALAITLIVQEPSANQALLNEFALSVLAFNSLIYAPIIEETIYRGFLRRIIPKDTAFIIVSGLIFGLIHMLHGGQSMAQYLYIVEYCLLGGFLAYLYAKSDNICVAMLGHFCFNFIALVAMVLA